MRKILLLAMCLALIVTLCGTAEAKKQPYGGISKCKMCHQGMHANIYKRYMASKHAGAYKNMIAKYPAAAKDGTCLKCHTSGYKKGGFVPGDAKSIAEFGGVTCEGCHGPMGGHASNPSDAKLKKGKFKCYKCHFSPPSSGMHKHKGQLHGKN